MNASALPIISCRSKPRHILIPHLIALLIPPPRQSSPRDIPATFAQGVTSNVRLKFEGDGMIQNAAKKCLEEETCQYGMCALSGE